MTRAGWIAMLSVYAAAYAVNGAAIALAIASDAPAWTIPNAIALFVIVLLQIRLVMQEARRA